MAISGHGGLGFHLAPFTELLPQHTTSFEASLMADLAVLMRALADGAKDGPDPEENLWVPAGYTYFGQFVDHDLSFDSTSSLNPADRPPQGSHVPTNLRTPRFDLDCVYGDGPAAQPFMYEADGATLILDDDELPRASNGRAIIGDKRNDENRIVSGMQLGFIRYHNKIVSLLAPTKTWAPGALFQAAQNEVRWAYQLVLVEDFLPRIINRDVLADLADSSVDQRRHSYALYTEDKRSNVPREFVGAAYRFGHSGVRPGYRLNEDTLLPIFPVEGENPAASLLGFGKAPAGTNVRVDWSRFLPDTAPGADIDDTDRTPFATQPDNRPYLQFAYKLDPTIVDRLAVLPKNVPEPDAASEAAAVVTLPNAPQVSLALLNLLRGNAYGLPSGQAVSHALRAAGKPAPHIALEDLVVRADAGKRVPPGQTDEVQFFKWTPIDAKLLHHTPLWFYVLAEAQAPLRAAIPLEQDGSFPETVLLRGAGARTQLGWVGGRIVAEVFYGLLDSDPVSVFRHKDAFGFVPRMAGNKRVCLRNLLDFGVT